MDIRYPKTGNKFGLNQKVCQEPTSSMMLMHMTSAAPVGGGGGGGGDVLI